MIGKDDNVAETPQNTNNYSYSMPYAENRKIPFDYLFDYSSFR